VNFTKYYYDDQNKEVQMGGVCSAHGRDDKYIEYFAWKI